MTLDVRTNLKVYLMQSLPVAQINYESCPECRELVDSLADVFLVSNDGLEEHIKSEIDNAPSNKESQRRKTWKTQLRRASYAFCEGLYIELDVSDVYLKANAVKIPCSIVLENRDCIKRAVKHTHQIIKARPRSYGWSWFAKSAA